MKKNLIISLWFTAVTTVIFGILYPLAVTGLSQLFFAKQANGQLLELNGKVVGSRIIGQAFTGPGYFRSRPSAAGTGNGYDSTASGGSNLGPTNKTLADRIQADAQKLHAEKPGAPIPTDLLTTSGSGLDPNISPASAEFQVQRVARARHMSETDLRAVVAHHTLQRQFGFLGEPSVNVLELNLDLDKHHPVSQ